MRSRTTVCRRGPGGLSARAGPLQSGYAPAPSPASPGAAGGSGQQRDFARAATQSLQQAYEAASTSAEPFSTELYNPQYSNAVTLTGSLTADPDMKTVTGQSGCTLLAKLNLRIKQGSNDAAGWCAALHHSLRGRPRLYATQGVATWDSTQRHACAKIVDRVYTCVAVPRVTTHP